MARRGVALAREGRWEPARVLLGRVAAAKRVPELPGLFYSYLGFGLAKYERRHREGLSLCEYAVKLDFCEGEAYLNLARVLLLSGRRRRALGVLNRGLAVAADSRALQSLRSRMGVRRAPVLPFLSRSNPVNRVLGTLRHRARERRWAGRASG